MQQQKIGTTGYLQVWVGSYIINGEQCDRIDIYDNSQQVSVVVDQCTAVSLSELLLEAASEVQEDPPGLIGG